MWLGGWREIRGVEVGRGPITEGQGEGLTLSGTPEAVGEWRVWSWDRHDLIDVTEILGRTS